MIFFLPILTHADPSTKEGVSRALAFAALAGAELNAGVQEVEVPRITNPLAAAMVNVAAMAAAAEASSRSLGESLWQHVDAEAAARGLRVGRQAVTCRPDDTANRMAQAARPHDGSLVAIDGDGQAHRALAETLLFGSGGPVLLLPVSGAPAHLDTAIVAWDGSVSAVRAVRDALPFLERAAKTAILTIGDDKPIDPASVEALRRYLSRHGIAAQHIEARLDGRPVGEALQAHALANGAGLLVMGAYGHNRLRQFVLGGATRSILAGIRLPILMSH